MRTFICFVISLLCCVGGLAQSDLQKLVDAEHAFAQMAAEKGTKAAFLANFTDDALVFTPDKTNAKPYWEARKPNGSLLSWAPNYADISSNGILGYTTGNWEWREKGKGDTPSAFGDFITLWQLQPDGKYKWVVDIGVTHAKPEKYSTEWATAKAAASGQSSTPTSDAAAEFYQLAAAKGVTKAYETFADENIRSYREDKLPILGKRNVLKTLNNENADWTIEFAKRAATFSSADISYCLNTYYLKTKEGKVTVKGNFLQIWKFYGGKWHIMLDIFKPVP